MSYCGIGWPNKSRWVFAAPEQATCKNCILFRAKSQGYNPPPKPHVIAGRAISKELKDKFRSTGLSVNTKRDLGGHVLSIQYFDGPTVQQVREFISQSAASKTSDGTPCFRAVEITRLMSVEARKRLVREHNAKCPPTGTIKRIDGWNTEANCPNHELIETMFDHRAFKRTL